MSGDLTPYLDNVLAFPKTSDYGAFVTAASELQLIKTRLCAADADLAREQGQRRSIGLSLEAAKQDLARLRDENARLKSEQNASGALRDSHRLLLDENARLRETIRWALGEVGNFPMRQDGDGRYWWRTELRARAALVRREVEAARDEDRMAAICSECWGDGERVPHTDEEAEQDDPRVCPTATSHPIADTGDYGTHCNCPKVPCSRCEKGKCIAALWSAEMIARDSQAANAKDTLSKPASARTYEWGNQVASHIADGIAALRARTKEITGGDIKT